MIDGADYAHADLDLNGTAESITVDPDHDGIANAFVTDVDGDGVADLGVADVDGDHYADIGVIDASHAPVGGEIATPEPWTAPAPVGDLYPTGAGSVPGVTGDTASTLASVNSAMNSASTLYHDALDPGSESPGDVAAATQHAQNAGRNAALLEGDIHQREVSNDIAKHEQVQQTLDESREAEMSAWTAVNAPSTWS